MIKWLNWTGQGLCWGWKCLYYKPWNKLFSTSFRCDQTENLRDLKLNLLNHKQPTTDLKLSFQLDINVERIVETNCCPSCFYIIYILFILPGGVCSVTKYYRVHLFIWLHFEKHGLHKVGHLLRNGDRTDCRFGGDLTSAWRCVIVDCWVKHLWYYIQTTNPNRKVSLVSNVLPSVSVRVLWWGTMLLLSFVISPFTTAGDAAKLAFPPCISAAHYSS